MKVRSFVALVSVFLLVIFIGCTTKPSIQIEEETVNEKEAEKGKTEEAIEVERVAKAPLEEGNIHDNKRLYKDSDEEESVITMYLTVSKGNEADGSNHTWEEINTYSVYDYEAMGVDRYKVEGILRIDDTGNGIDENSFGYGEEVPNVSIQVRGQTSSRSDWKNYKIRIKDGKGDFRDQRTLDLNKHRGDPYRFINKLCYDLLDPIPQLVGGRTQFVHLYVNDQTKITEGEDYEDYGLYTMVEQVNKTYLKHRGLDSNGHLYKVTFFEWGKYDAVMTSLDDPEFDRKAFEKYLEIKGDEDPAKLQRVVEEIHNYSIPIEDIVDKHFDAENICYWMAFNSLIGNCDVGARNLFLYSPLNSEKFYVICWDMDASFKTTFNARRDKVDGASWEQGMTNFLGLELINRMMKEDKYREMLEDAVEDIYKNYVNPSIVQKKIDTYMPITEEYTFRMPDLGNCQVDDISLYEELVSQVPCEVDISYKRFKESMEKPWPFFVDMPEVDDDGNLTFSWGVSYDHKGEDVSYSYYLAKDMGFEDVIFTREGLKVPLLSMEMLPEGTYYVRVVAENESGKRMECFDYMKYPHRGKAYGCFGFSIDSNGTIIRLE